MNLKESIRKVLREESEEQSKGPYIIFVSGIESAMSHKGQTSLFEQSAYTPIRLARTFFAIDVYNATAI